MLTVLVYLARRYRKRVWTRKEPPAGGLTIEKAEEMYHSGQISREEFSVLRRSTLGLPPRPSGARSGLSAPAQADDVSKAKEEPPPPIEKEQE